MVIYARHCGDWGRYFVLWNDGTTSAAGTEIEAL
jgi:hypothetical protein